MGLGSGRTRLATRRLKIRGKILFTEYKGVRVNKTKVSGDSHPVQIVTQWENPETHQLRPVTTQRDRSRISQDKLRSRLINAARLGRSFSLTALNFNPSPPPG